MRNFHENDTVVVGPTPLSKLVISGTVDGKDDSENTLMLRIDGMEAPSEAPNH
jgi:Predicted transcriptional regulator, contains C-terminal CBS domains